MKNRVFIFIIGNLAALAGYSQAFEKSSQAQERIIKDYFAGWVDKDWNQVSAQLANGFTFTSAAPDDHISTEKFKEKCWVQAQHIQKFEFVKFSSIPGETFVIVHVLTNDNRVIRNVEYFNFINGKIKSIEVFFGGAGQGFPTNER